LTMKKGPILRARKLSGRTAVQQRLSRIPVPSAILRSITFTGTVLCFDDLGIQLAAGSQNLRVNFSRYSQIRHVLTSKESSYSVRIGSNTLTPTSTGFSCPAGASAGATTIPVNKLGSELPVAGKYYFLYDLNKWETHADNAEERLVGGELIKVKSVTDGGSTATVVFEEPLSQPYESSVSPKTGNTILSKLPQVGGNDIGICENITIKGLRVNGISRDPNYVSWMWVLWSNGVIVRDFYGCESGSTGISFIRCRNALLENARGENIENKDNALEYTWQFQRCADVKVRRAYACNARYSVVMEAGTSKFNVIGAYGENIQESVFDIHGGDAYDGYIQYAIAWAGGQFYGSVALGNTAWRRGASNITLEDSVCSLINLRTAIRNSTVRRVSCRRVSFMARIDAPATDHSTEPRLAGFIVLPMCLRELRSRIRLLNVSPVLLLRFIRT